MILVSEKRNPEDYVAYESYSFSDEEYNKMKLFSSEMSDQTIEITPYKVAYYYVADCKQNKVKVKECKIDNISKG